MKCLKLLIVIITLQVCFGQYGAELKQLGRFERPNPSNRLDGTGRLDYIEFDPNNANVVYVCSNMGRLYKSEDGGPTWENVPLDKDLIPHHGVSSIAIDPNNSDHLVISTGSQYGVHGYSQPSSGIYYSTDGGISWNATNMRYYNKYEDDPVSEDPDYNFNMEHLDLDDQTGTFYPGGDFISKIEVDPQNPSVFYVCTSKGLYMSINSGVSWIKSTTMTEYVFDIDFNSLSGTVNLQTDPMEPTVLGTSEVYVSGTRVYMSNDGGLSWNNLTSVGSGLDLTAAPINPVYIQIEIESYFTSDKSFLFAQVNAHPNNLNSNLIGVHDIDLSLSTPTWDQIIGLDLQVIPLRDMHWRWDILG